MSRPSFAFLLSFFYIYFIGICTTAVNARVYKQALVDIWGIL